MRTGSGMLTSMRHVNEEEEEEGKRKKGGGFMSFTDTRTNEEVETRD